MKFPPQALLWAVASSAGAAVFRKFWKLWEVEHGWRKQTKLSTPYCSG